MKAYKEYMDQICVCGAQHQRFLAGSANIRRRRRFSRIRPYALAGVCLSIAILAAFGLPRLLDRETPFWGGQNLPDTANNLFAGVIIDGSGLDQGEKQTTASYAVPQAGDCQYIIPLPDALAYYAETDALFFVGVNIFTAAEDPLAEDSAELQAEIARLRQLGYRLGYSQAWTYQGQGEQVLYTYLSGLFTVEQLQDFPADSKYGYSFYFAQNGDGSAVAVDSDVFTATADESQQIDLITAYADADFAVYLPQSLPDGFTFASGYRVYAGERQYLNVLWTQGMREIYWQVSALEQEDQARITSVAERQNYDLALYPIPRADSVPEELRQIVDDPIFGSEELTLAVVKARAETAEDAGDVSGYRMRFGVAYGEVLVEISVKGATPEEVYQLLRQINP